MQGLDFCILGCGSFLQFGGQLRFGQLDSTLLVLLGQLQPFVQLLLKRAVAHLLQDVRIAGLVNLEGFVAVGADDFIHGLFHLWQFSRIHEFSGKPKFDVFARRVLAAVRKGVKSWNQTNGRTITGVTIRALIC